jgi:hypothetical protein
VIVWLQKLPVVAHASHLLFMPSFTSLYNPEQYKARCCIRRSLNICVGQECCPKTMLLSLNGLEMLDNRYLEDLKQLFSG